ncbi:hypothetical protein [Azorhizophilus paspali]|uniref:Phage protein n=1 Tax=Azorhizophilus paspali TaxID=69963 RepID=A0ABV6SJU9_AZOPA
MSRIDPTRGLGPALTLEQAVDHDTRRTRGGPVAVCATLGWSYNAYQKKLSISYPDNLLSVRDFERWLELVEAEETLRAIARIRGGVFYLPAPVTASAAAPRALADPLRHEAAFVGSLHQGAADGCWEEREALELERHGNQVIEAVLGIMAGARAAMERDLEGRDE